jgi:hypothetical protein
LLKTCLLDPRYHGGMKSPERIVIFGREFDIVLNIEVLRIAAGVALVVAVVAGWLAWRSHSRD